MTLCHECRRVHKSKNYCFQCWPKRKTPRRRSPTLAMILSVVPGLGQAYGGSFLRGVLFLGGCIFSLALLEVVPIPVPLFVYLLNLWDARMTALRRNERVLGADEGGASKKRESSAAEADWMLWGATALLAFLFLWMPQGMGVAVESWMVWTGFVVAYALSVLMGRGGRRDVQKA